MITDEMKELLENNAVALSTIDSEGNPHTIAVAACKIVEDKIIITDNFMKETPENLNRNNKATIAVWSKEWEQDDCKAFEIKGTAEYLTKGKWIEFVKKLRENQGLAAKGAIVLTPIKIKKLS